MVWPVRRTVRADDLTRLRAELSRPFPAIYPINTYCDRCCQVQPHLATHQLDPYQETCAVCGRQIDWGSSLKITLAEAFGQLGVLKPTPPAVLANADPAMPVTRYPLTTGLSLDDTRTLVALQPWLNRPDLVIAEVPGYQHGQFGGKARQLAHVDNIFHEFAHAIELFITAPDRLQFAGFALRTPRDSRPGQLLCEPATTLGIERELRVIGIQLVLMRDNPGIEIDWDSFITQACWVLRTMFDFANIAKLHLRLPAGTSSGQLTRRSLHWCRGQIHAAMLTHPIDRLKPVWPLALATLLSQGENPNE